MTEKGVEKNKKFTENIEDLKKKESKDFSGGKKDIINKDIFKGIVKEKKGNITSDINRNVLKKDDYTKKREEVRIKRERYKKKQKVMNEESGVVNNKTNNTNIYKGDNINNHFHKKEDNHFHNKENITILKGENKEGKKIINNVINNKETVKKAPNIVIQQPIKEEVKIIRDVTPEKISNIITLEKMGIPRRDLDRATKIIKYIPNNIQTTELLKRNSIDNHNYQKIKNQMLGFYSLIKNDPNKIQTIIKEVHTGKNQKSYPQKNINIVNNNYHSKLDSKQNENNIKKYDLLERKVNNLVLNNIGIKKYLEFSSSKKEKDKYDKIKEIIKNNNKLQEIVKEFLGEKIEDTDRIKKVKSWLVDFYSDSKKDPLNTKQKIERLKERFPQYSSGLEKFERMLDLAGINSKKLGGGKKFLRDIDSNKLLNKEEGTKKETHGNFKNFVNKNLIEKTQVVEGIIVGQKSAGQIVGNKQLQYKKQIESNHLVNKIEKEKQIKEKMEFDPQKYMKNQFKSVSSKLSEIGLMKGISFIIAHWNYLLTDYLIRVFAYSYFVILSLVIVIYIGGGFLLGVKFGGSSLVSLVIGFGILFFLWKYMKQDDDSHLEEK